MASSLEESVDSSIQNSSQDSQEPSIQDSTQNSSVQEPSSLATESTVESSFDATQESAVTESNTDGGVEDDDEDDELLALRIAALESIQIKKDSKKKSTSRPGSPGQGSGEGATSSTHDDQTKKPDYVLKKHDQRKNLVSIVTGEEEIVQSLTVPPPLIPMVFNYPPPIGLVGAPPSPIRHHPDNYRYPPPTYRSRSRSPSFERRRSLSPRRYRSPPRRYGSLSPPYRSPPPLSRRSPDRRITPTRRLTPTRQLSPTNRRYTSPPPPLGRRMTPPQYRRSPGERWSSPPPGSRSPPGAGGLRRSPYSYNKRQTGRSTMHRGTNYRREPFKPRTDNRQQHRKPLPDSDPSAAVSSNKPAASESEWETDTDPPTDEEDAGKPTEAKPDSTADTTADADKSKDSVKGEASEKENTDSTEQSKDNEKDQDKSTDNDETSNSNKVALTSEQSHDDVLKLDASAEVDEFSKFLNEIEDEVLNEKKEEKKDEIKEKPEKKPRIQTERKTLEGKKLRKKLKPPREGTPSFSDEDNTTHPRNRQPGGGSRYGRQDWRQSQGNNGTQYSSERGRDSNNREDRKQWEERREREKREYEERVERREKERKELEERREKERKEYEEKLAKMTPLERERLEARRRKFEARGEVELDKPKKISLKRDTVDSDDEDARAKLSLKKRDSRSSLPGNDKSDQWRRERSLSPSEGNRRQSPPGGGGSRKQHVTDLRVQLHKKKQLAGAGRTEDSHQQDHAKESFNRKSAERNVRKSAERNNGRKVRVTEREDSVEVDDDLLEDKMEDGRVPPLTSTHRVIMPPMFMKEKDDVVSEQSDRSPSPPRPSSRGSRKVKMRPISPSLQHNTDDLDIDKLGFTEEEVQKEMKNLLSQRKKKKKEKKEKKEKKKPKKKKKSSKSKLDKVEPKEDDDFMNELDHFEKMLEAGDDDLPDFRSRSKSGSRNRNSSGSKSTSRSRHSSSLSDEMKLSIRAASTEKFRGLGDSLGSKLKQRLGQKVKEERVDTDLAPLNKKKLKRKSREILQSDEENEEIRIKVAKKNKRVIHSNSKGLESDEENEDLILKMAKKNKKRLERAKEIELDRLMHS